MHEAFTHPVTLVVYGIPQPQGSKTGFVSKRTQKVVMVEGRRPAAREAFKSWRQAVAAAASDWQRGHGAGLCDEPCTMSIAFRLPRPPSIPKKRSYPSTRPDLDKLARAVFDALTGVLISDDSRVVQLYVAKHYAAPNESPGCTITLEVLP